MPGWWTGLDSSLWAWHGWCRCPDGHNRSFSVALCHLRALLFSPNFASVLAAFSPSVHFHQCFCRTPSVLHVTGSGEDPVEGHVGSSPSLSVDHGAGRSSCFTGLHSQMWRAHLLFPSSTCFLTSKRLLKICCPHPSVVNISEVISSPDSQDFSWSVSLRDYGRIYMVGRLFPIHGLFMLSSESVGQNQHLHFTLGTFFLKHVILKGMKLWGISL